MKFKTEKYTCKCGHVITVEYDEDDPRIECSKCNKKQERIVGSRTTKKIEFKA